MSDLYESKIKAIKSLPPLYSTIEKNPTHAFFYIVTLSYWDMKKMDYVEKETLAYFDGSNWYDVDVYNFESTNWITNWRHAKAEELF